MNPSQILSILLRLGGDLSDGGKWQASHRIDGAQTAERPKVTSFRCGLQDGKPWLAFEFTEPDGAHTLRGEVNIGGGAETIKYDGQDVDDDDVILSYRLRGAQIRGVVEFEFVSGGKTHRYRFDATVARLV